MFGKRSAGAASAPGPEPRIPAAAPAPRRPEPAAAAPENRRTVVPEAARSEEYYQMKSMIFGALIEAIDLSQLAKLDSESAREEIRDIINEIISLKNVVLSIAEQEELLDDICNDVLGYGPLEPLLARDDIADIMVNGAKQVYIEVNGKVEQTNVRFRDNAQLMNICQRSSARSAGASTKARRSATRALPTAPASTSSRRRWRSTAPLSPSASSRRTS